MELLKKYVSFVLFIISVGWVLRVLLLPNYPDFQVHYYGAQHLVQRENPYILDANYFTPQVYPPFDMVFFIPLSFLPYDIAAKVWIILSIGAIFLSIVLINRIYKVSFFSPLSLFLSSLVFIAFPTKFTLGMGQINAVILLFTVLIWYYLNKKEYIKSGVAYAFPVMLKFFPLLLGPYLVIHRKWKILFSMAISMLTLFLISLAFVSLETHVYFFQTILPDLLRSWKGDYYNQSFTGLLMRSTAEESLRQPLRLIIPSVFLIITFGVILLKHSKDSVRVNLEIAILLSTSLLINNFSWQHHFILLLLPYFIIIYTLRESKNKWIYILVAISYALVAINFVRPDTIPNIVQSHVFFGGLILWIINLSMLFKYKK